jgi:hypothetical protein
MYLGIELNNFSTELIPQVNILLHHPFQILIHLLIARNKLFILFIDHKSQLVDLDFLVLDQLLDVLLLST